MKYINGFRVSMITILLLLPGFSVEQAQACACCGTYRVINVKENDQLAVRSGPGQNFKSIAWLHPDESCIIKKSECQRDWCPIEFGNIKGWVNSYYLAIINPGPATEKQAENQKLENR